MAYLDWHYNISETLFESMGLNKHQAWELNYADESKLYFWNLPGKYSHLCYAKGGHTVIEEILEMCDSEFRKSKLPEEDIIVIPYKDPLDKFISAYFTSFEFKAQKPDGSTSELWAATAKVKPEQVNDLVDVCYNRLDKFMKRAVEQSVAENEVLNDNHFTPIHVILLKILKDYGTVDASRYRFQLLGINLDNNPNQFIFNDIRNHPDIPLELKNRLNYRTSANNDIIKIASTRWKQINQSTSKIIIEKFLWNDYRLIDQLARNTVMANVGGADADWPVWKGSCPDTIWHQKSTKI